MARDYQCPDYQCWRRHAVRLQRRSITPSNCSSFPVQCLSARHVDMASAVVFAASRRGMVRLTLFLATGLPAPRQGSPVNCGSRSGAYAVLLSRLTSTTSTSVIRSVPLLLLLLVPQPLRVEGTRE